MRSSRSVPPVPKSQSQNPSVMTARDMAARSKDSVWAWVAWVIAIRGIIHMVIVSAAMIQKLMNGTFACGNGGWLLGYARKTKPRSRRGKVVKYIMKLPTMGHAAISAPDLRPSSSMIPNGTMKDNPIHNKIVGIRSSCGAVFSVLGSLFSCWGNRVQLVVGRTLFCVSR